MLWSLRTAAQQQSSTFPAPPDIWPLTSENKEIENRRQYSRYEDWGSNCILDLRTGALRVFYVRAGALTVSLNTF